MAPDKKMNKWIKFDGIKNMPAFLRSEFSLPSGSFEIKKLSIEGKSGIEISGRTIKIWGDENAGYSSLLGLAMEKPGYLPETRIDEKPGFEFRGYHLDIGRGGVPTLEYFKKILRLMFLCKYNYFAIYFEDLFPWKKYPQIGAGRGRLTREELKEIVEYGRKLGIEVFPSLELSGHMEYILVLNEFGDFSEWHNGWEGCLDVSNPKARKFAYGLLEDVIDFFDSCKYIHIGGDETWAMGRGTSLDKTRKFMGPQLYRMHHKNMINIVRKSGKIPILWHDMIAGCYLHKEAGDIWSKILKDRMWDKALLADWGYGVYSRKESLKKIELLGKRQQVVCPGLSNWSRIYPDFDAALVNMKNFAAAGIEKKVEGYLNTSWGDDGQECLYSYVEPLIVAMSEFGKGSLRWQEKWLAISNETRDVLNIRMLLGGKDVSNNIKKVLFWNSQIDKRVRLLWKSVINSAREMKLPEDLRLAIDLLRLGLDKLEGKMKQPEIMRLGTKYSQLWQKERKKENLDKVLGRFNYLYGKTLI